MENEIQKDPNTYVAIMAGGIGSRFWPLSRVDYPKQFLDVLGTGKTLIQITYERFARLVPLENIYVITANEYLNITEEQLPGLPRENILGEPFQKEYGSVHCLYFFQAAATEPRGFSYCGSRRSPDPEREPLFRNLCRCPEFRQSF
jgi:mannose-1-phosphate guanylyltransferase